MIVGLGLFALPVGIVATAFVERNSPARFRRDLGMLSRVPLFEASKSKTMGNVMNALRSQVVSPDSKIAEAGERPQAMYFVVSGDVEEEHPELGKRRLAPGSHFGEEALLHGKPHEATVTAHTRARVLVAVGVRFRPAGAALSAPEGADYGSGGRAHAAKLSYSWPAVA